MIGNCTQQRKQMRLLASAIADDEDDSLGRSLGPREAQRAIFSLSLLFVGFSMLSSAVLVSLLSTYPHPYASTSHLHWALSRPHAAQIT